ncbi:MULTISPECIES: carboxylesterase/lipase family protein [unclassified Streptomyces]|uniref:carboxylesterase/lipase family protein n=1 Tax=unclassified Streptomyces TaxID=2593676 RepID=UPI001BE4E48F|nr:MULTISPECIES: carboxylesterase family protein [unclassified Streptomyces]MBT2404240.1 carboxylesterase/lipase family protein [Streptomyces sp. ISL-21]
MRRLTSARPLLGTALVLVALLASALPATASPGDPGGSPRPVVTVAQGALRGQVHDGAQEFLGVPYAAPPVGESRLREPREPRRWNGVREATEHAPACVQFAPFGLRDPQAVSEDCLYLDVYRPRNARAGARLPVVFWMHGGAYSMGTGSQFGGRTMAELTDSVVVSINYRLGQLGYLALPELGGENAQRSGSFGLMDQIAALRWTRENIGAFGGNPGNVTVSGQSAGSGSVCGLLAAPSAAGLFHRAVLQSGPCTLLRTPDGARAGADARAFAERVGCADPAGAAACLRAASAASLVEAARTLPTSGPASGDGLLPVEPAAAIGSGAWNKVPVLIGSTRSESRFFVALSQPYLTAEQYTAQVLAGYGAAGAEVLARYPVSAYASPYLALSAVMTDSTFACHTAWTAQLFAAQVPTYAYEFDDPESPTLAGAQVPGLDESNGHSAELAYLHDFTMGERPLTPVQTALATRMKRYWGAFARAGTPSVPGQPQWPATGPGGPGTFLTLNPVAIRTNSSFTADHQCGFWRTQPPRPVL